MKRTLFPADFLWGASTAAHQVEGNTHNQWSEWEQANAERLASTAKQRLGWNPHWERIAPQATKPENYISGTGVGHYHHFREDFDVLGRLNMNAFRFSIEWSRLEPAEGQWDKAAIEHYRAYLQELRKRNITPVLTLWHWTMPVWFAGKGGFEKRQNLRYWERYVAKVAELFATELSYVITLNEPNVYTAMGYLSGVWPPARKAPFAAMRIYHNLVYAHRRAYRIIKAANPEVRVGIAAQLENSVAANSRNMWNRWLVRGLSYCWNWWFLDRIASTQDFIGFNYYFTTYYNWRGKRCNPSTPVSDMGWYMEPGGILPVLERLAGRYDKSVIITENGLADAEDAQRQWWIAETLAALELARERGVDVRGYLYWSLLDNFEWADGWWPKFGLVAIDRQAKACRTLRPSAQWFGKQIEAYRRDGRR